MVRNLQLNRPIEEPLAQEMPVQAGEFYRVMPEKNNLELNAHASSLQGSAQRTTTSLKSVAEKRQDIYWINPYSLQIRDGWNARSQDDPQNAAHVEDLAQQIAVEGVKVPLTVYLDRTDKAIYVVDGHMRLAATIRAIELLGAKIVSIPCKTDEKADDEAERMKYQILANNGKRLTTYERARLFSRYADLGWSEKRIGCAFNINHNYVNQLIRLFVEAPEEMRRMISNGTITATLALDVARHADGNFQEATEHLSAAVEKAMRHGKQKATKKILSGAEGKPRPTLSAIRATMGELLEVLTPAVSSLKAVTPGDPDEQVPLYLRRRDIDRMLQVLASDQVAGIWSSSSDSSNQPTGQPSYAR